MQGHHTEAEQHGTRQQAEHEAALEAQQVAHQAALARSGDEQQAALTAALDRAAAAEAGLAELTQQVAARKAAQQQERRSKSIAERVLLRRLLRRLKLGRKQCAFEQWHAQAFVASTMEAMKRKNLQAHNAMLEAAKTSHIAALEHGLAAQEAVLAERASGRCRTEVGAAVELQQRRHAEAMAEAAAARDAAQKEMLAAQEVAQQAALAAAHGKHEDMLQDALEQQRRTQEEALEETAAEHTEIWQRRLVLAEKHTSAVARQVDEGERQKEKLEAKLRATRDQARTAQEAQGAAEQKAAAAATQLKQRTVQLWQSVLGRLPRLLHARSRKAFQRWAMQVRVAGVTTELTQRLTTKLTGERDEMVEALQKAHQASQEETSEQHRAEAAAAKAKRQRVRDARKAKAKQQAQQAQQAAQAALEKQAQQAALAKQAALARSGEEQQAALTAALDRAAAAEAGHAELAQQVAARKARRDRILKRVALVRLLRAVRLKLLSAFGRLAAWAHTAGVELKLAEARQMMLAAQRAQDQAALAATQARMHKPTEARDASSQASQAAGHAATTGQHLRHDAVLGELAAARRQLERSERAQAAHAASTERHEAERARQAEAMRVMEAKLKKSREAMKVEQKKRTDLVACVVLFLRSLCVVLVVSPHALKKSRTL